MLDTLPKLEPIAFPPLTRRSVETLQVNLGYRCNQRCLHCHVNAGPTRKEQMAAEMIETLIAVLERGQVRTLDLTGGAPELHPQFRHLVETARALGLRVIDRCNLTILHEPGQEGLAEFLAAQSVEVVASMPCYLQQNVDAQRGKGVFEGSIRGLQRLNALGYGKDTDKVLNLVYNPQGPSLPPPQGALQQDYQQRLAKEYGIVFNQLLTITNMPIKRFGSTLLSRGQFDDYMQLLQQAHLEANLDSVMCRTLISVDWQGRLYDCDFNQMLDLPLLPLAGERAPLTLSDLQSMAVAGRPIAVRGHCYGCTAGQGSSCGGSLS
jgi:radical SAM/Cys-rich protein